MPAGARVAWRPAVAGGCIAAVVVVPLVVGGTRLARTQIDEDAGPTAATLDEGFAAITAGALVRP